MPDAQTSEESALNRVIREATDRIEAVSQASRAAARESSELEEIVDAARAARDKLHASLAKTADAKAQYAGGVAEKERAVAADLSRALFALLAEQGKPEASLYEAIKGDPIETSLFPANATKAKTEALMTKITDAAKAFDVQTGQMTHGVETTLATAQQSYRDVVTEQKKREAAFEAATQEVQATLAGRLAKLEAMKEANAAKDTALEGGEAHLAAYWATIEFDLRTALWSETGVEIPSGTSAEDHYNGLVKAIEDAAAAKVAQSAGRLDSQTKTVAAKTEALLNAKAQVAAAEKLKAQRVIARLDRLNHLFQQP